MELQRNTHHVYRIMNHFVWIPKYRHKVFVEPRREAMKSIIHKIGYDTESEVEIIVHKIESGRLLQSFKTNREHVNHVKQIVKNKSAV